MMESVDEKGGQVVSIKETQVGKLDSVSHTIEVEPKSKIPKLMKQDTGKNASSHSLLPTFEEEEEKENNCLYRSRAIAKAGMLQAKTVVNAPSFADLLIYAQEVLMLTAELNQLGVALLQALLLKQKDKTVEIYEKCDCGLRELATMIKLVNRCEGRQKARAIFTENELYSNIPDVSIEPPEYCIIVGASPIE
ncbi:unnamed protein product [Hydatigera taeniaeformis]|uniref:E3 ubiquitin-protein ligase SHPRH n=1 Tax=Hydatigena taeniaeformis TaxID=6205 RepID=A0A0R3WM80_HYDTA|nr:unnamed protein product [Hydatigera taeniaeformis]